VRSLLLKQAKRGAFKNTLSLTLEQVGQIAGSLREDIDLMASNSPQSLQK
jgi:hypothetical protein